MTLPTTLTPQNSSKHIRQSDEDSRRRTAWQHRKRDLENYEEDGKALFKPSPPPMEGWHQQWCHTFKLC